MDLKKVANQLRRDSLISTSSAKSGHPTSCMSSAEIFSVLFFDQLKKHDEFILSKGHASPILYASMKRKGWIKDDIKTLRKLYSRLEGHPNPRTFPVKVGTGSLGQGLSAGLGMALSSKIKKRNDSVFVLMGDGEIAEGSVYEAAELAGYYKVSNLIGIVDVNKLGQSGVTMVGHKIRKYKKRFEGFGWKVYVINGHKINQVKKAIISAKKQSRPSMILARTDKGHGVPFLSGKQGWHGKALNEEQLKKALSYIPEYDFQLKYSPIKISVKKHKKQLLNHIFKDEVATREAYGTAIAKIVKKNGDVIVLDAEVRASTHASEALKVSPKQFFDCFIAEQNMVGMGLGLAVSNHPVFMSTFAAFFTRAHDQIRMATLSKANLNFVGSHVGCSIGEDGVSQMGLEDMAMFRTIPNSIVLYPSDANSTLKLVGEMIGQEELCYLRTTRAKTPLIYSSKELFPIGKFKVVKKSKSKNVVVAAGITLHEAVKVDATVIDAYSIKPFPVKDLQKITKGKNVVVVEDHYEQGGLGEVVMSALSGTGIKIKHLCVRSIPHSGKPKELLKKYKIDSTAIEKAMKSF